MVISSALVQFKIQQDMLVDKGNPALWVQINKVIDFNLEHRIGHGAAVKGGVG